MSDILRLLLTKYYLYVWLSILTKYYFIILSLVKLKYVLWVLFTELRTTTGTLYKLVRVLDGVPISTFASQALWIISTETNVKTHPAEKHVTLSYDSYAGHTWVSGSSEPKLAAPSLTTSASLVMVDTEDWAAWASFSWLAPAPDTSSLVSSTRALAVFRIYSLHTGRSQSHQLSLSFNKAKTVHIFNKERQTAAGYHCTWYYINI